MTPTMEREPGKPLGRPVTVNEKEMLDILRAKGDRNEPVVAPPIEIPSDIGTTAARRMLEDLQVDYKMPPDATIRIAVPPSEEEMEFARDLAEFGAPRSVFHADLELGGIASWHWPLRVGTLAEPSSDPLRDMVSSYHYAEPLIESVELGEASWTCDLLLLPNVERLEALGTRHTIRASFVLVLEDEEELLSRNLLRRWARIVHASGIAIVRRPADLPEFFRNFMDVLAHDQPIDVALARTGVPYDLLADTKVLNETRVTRTLRRLKRRARAPRATEVLGEAEARDLSDGLERLESEARGYLRESGDASAAARETRGRAADIERMEEPGPERRWLQCQVFAQERNALVQRKSSFRPDTRHEIRVRVAPSDLDWIRNDRELPDIKPPAGEPTASLRVAWFAPGLKPPHAEATLELPSKGPSTLTVFDVHVPADLERVRAWITLSYRNRHLQTAELSGPIALIDGAVSGRGIELATGDPPGHELSHLDPVDLLIEKMPDHHVLLSARDSTSGNIEEWRIEFADLLPTLGIIQEMLKDRANESLVRALAPKAMAELFVGLATHGNLFRERLFRDHETWIDRIGSVEVITRDESDFLPVEFLYDGGSLDEGAAICPTFLATVGTGACDHDPDPTVVCPGSFWSLNRVIGRQMRSAGGRPSGEASPPEATSRRDRLPSFDRVLFGASHKVDQEDPDTSSRLDRDMRAMVPQCWKVDLWKDWEKHVQDESPPILLAVVHHDEVVSLRIPSLEIGTDTLRYDRLAREHVLKLDLEPPLSPVVILLGCNTAVPPNPVYGFVSRMREKGAAVVVGTLPAISGRWAATAGIQLVRAFRDAEGSGGGRLGEVMRGARQRLVKEGNPLALAIVAYGDVDWKLGGA